MPFVNPAAPHNTTIDGMYGYVMGTLLKTLLDKAENEPNPAEAARRVMNDLQNYSDSSTDGVVLPALLAATSLYTAP